MSSRIRSILSYMMKDKRRQEILSNVARLLREEREKKGISMTALASKAGLSQQMVSYIERGLRNPTLDSLLRITDAMNSNLTRIIKKAME